MGSVTRGGVPRASPDVVKPSSSILAAAALAALAPSSCQAADKAPAPTGKPWVESFSQSLSS